MKMERERRTPEQDEEEERDRSERYERAVEHGDYLRDAMRDRQCEKEREDGHE